MEYSQSQWILTFFIYCVCGWIWECLYVSVKEHRWVNRGFLHGPWLPIYGSGAILVLFLTLPLRECPVLVFAVGMVGATLLEYLTGAVMERIFQMRYWDYSNLPINVNGYICLPVSMAWGGFSVILIMILHPPVERIVCSVWGWAAELIATCLTVLFVTDCVSSIRAALDMRGLLTRLGEQREALREMEEHLNAVLEQISIRSEAFRRQMAELGDVILEKKEEYQQEKHIQQLRRKKRVLEALRRRRDQKSAVLSLLAKKTDTAMTEIMLRTGEAASEQERRYWSSLAQSVTQFRRTIGRAEAELEDRRDREYQTAIAILKRNPGAVSKQHKNALEELKEMKQ